MRRFLHLACLALVFCSSTVSTLAQPEALIETGLQPLALLADGTELHVFCNRLDLNFDGMQDEGDSPASWWVIDQRTKEAAQRVEFDWDDGFGFPFRPAIDRENGILYLPLSEEVRPYNARDGQVVTSALEIPYVASAAYFDAANSQLLISQRQMGGDDILRTFDVNSGATQTYAVGDNVQQSLVWTDAASARHLLVLCEGIFGEENSTLSVLTPGAEPVRADIALGGTGNHLLLEGDLLYVTMNADHEIHEIDLNQMSIVRSFDVGTSEFNGPRDAVIVDGDLYVTTYADDVRRISLADGTVKAILSSAARPEGIVDWDGRLWIANAYEPASFTSDRTIAVLHPKLSSEVLAIVPTVMQPAHLATSQDGVIAFGNQIDLNFNTMQDEGDLPQTVALHSRADFSSEWESELPWGGGGFPLRPTLNRADDRAYVITGRQVTFQSLNSSMSGNLDGVNLGNAAALNYSPLTKTLAITERGDASGMVRLLDLSGGDFNERSISGLTPFVQQSIWTGDISQDFDLIVLEEGNFTGGAGRLVYVNTASATIFEALELGAGANHMLLDGNLLYITINGAHEVVVVDLTQNTITQRIPTGTEGFNGPRESILFNGDLYVTTYSNDVRRFDLATGEMTARYETGGKPEGITAYNNRIWVANAFEFNDFASGYTLAIIQPADAITSVHAEPHKEDLNSEMLMLSPNPAAQSVRIKMLEDLQLDGAIQLEVTALDGRVVHRQIANAADVRHGAQQVNVAGLAAGAYVVTLRAGNVMQSARLFVQP